MNLSRPRRPHFLLGGAAIALTWATASLLNSKRQQQEQRLPQQLLPRFFLLQSLLEKVDELGTTCSKDDWLAFYNELKDVLKKALDAIQKVIPAQPGAVVAQRSVEQVTRVIDEKLLRLIQSKPTLAEALDEDVPSNHQTWSDFVALKLTRDEKLKEIFEAELGGDGYHQTELLKNCQKLVKELIRQLHEVNKASFGGATRNNITGIEGISQTPPQRDNCSIDDLTSANVPRRPHLGKCTSGSTPVMEHDYDITKILYATDRQFTEDGISNGVTRKLCCSSCKSWLQYGMMEVAIPRKHVTGKLEAPLGSEEADPSKHVIILSMDTKPRHNKTEFLEMANEHVLKAKKSSPISSNSAADILIFVHGFRSTLTKAVKRAAQLKKDLEFQGIVILYSWSSQGTPWGYFQDEKNVRKTVLPLDDFIYTITHQVTEANKVHLMAHSMGNRALVRALTRHFKNLAGDELVRKPRVPLSQVVFAAADETHQRFLDLVETLKDFKGKLLWNSTQDSSPSSNSGSVDGGLPTLTVYCSTDDTALQASRSLHLQVTPRLGDLRSYLRGNDVALLDEFVDVVDATGVGLSNFQHSYFCDVGQVLTDLKAVLQCHRAAARIGSTVHRASNKELKAYYSFRKQKSFDD
ncbi:hypothetical protein M758_9G166100 [Ceratodon purpureus]|nr:hypothetical protein M758_9G166100 [Ceratodon purpureus]KAG0606771.1 hypothetical protein M758_9G166100 [Ceratodon purpureus]